VCAGVVPAIASLDVLTVFAGSVEDAATVAKIMRSGDAGAADVWRRSPLPVPTPAAGAGFRFGVPGPAFTEWEGAGECKG
jgi:Asp-tRNA(Asn)/Glu-tRNA(Gln) amidotransferase A subunit family amidase